MPMAKAVQRPKITVQAVYSGGLDMQEVFVSLLVNEVRRGKHSVHTFEIVKEPEYNLTTTTEKEAS
jgi:hypothetical protein